MPIWSNAEGMAALGQDLVGATVRTGSLSANVRKQLSAKSGQLPRQESQGP